MSRHKYWIPSQASTVTRPNGSLGSKLCFCSRGWYNLSSIHKHEATRTATACKRSDSPAFLAIELYSACKKADCQARASLSLPMQGPATPACEPFDDHLASRRKAPHHRRVRGHRGSDGSGGSGGRLWRHINWRTLRGLSGRRRLDKTHGASPAHLDGRNGGLVVLAKDLLVILPEVRAVCLRRVRGGDRNSDKPNTCNASA